MIEFFSLNNLIIYFLFINRIKILISFQISTVIFVKDALLQLFLTTKN